MKRIDDPGETGEVAPVQDAPATFKQKVCAWFVIGLLAAFFWYFVATLISRWFR